MLPLLLKRARLSKTKKISPGHPHWTQVCWSYHQNDKVLSGLVLSCCLRWNESTVLCWSWVNSTPMLSRTAVAFRTSASDIPSACLGLSTIFIWLVLYQSVSLEKKYSKEYRVANLDYYINLFENLSHIGLCSNLYRSPITKSLPIALAMLISVSRVAFLLPDSTLTTVALGSAAFSASSFWVIPAFASTLSWMTNCSIFLLFNFFPISFCEVSSNILKRYSFGLCFSYFFFSYKYWFNR